MKKILGIDIGASNIRATFGGSKISLICEPSVIAIDKNEDKIIACGSEAINLSERIPGAVKIIYPFSGEHSPNKNYAEAIMSHMLKKCKANNPVVYISYSGKQSKESEKILVKSLQDCGAEDVIAVDPSYAAACGCGVSGMGDNTIINIGASVVDMSSYCRSKMIAKRTNSYAGNAVDKAISIAIFRKYRMSITPEEAERLKLCGASLTGKSDDSIVFAAIKPTVGLPFNLLIKKSEISSFIESVTDDFFDEVIDMMRNLQSEPDKIVLTGGGANLDGIGPVLESIVHIPVIVADEPENAAIRGLHHIINSESD